MLDRDVIETPLLPTASNLRAEMARYKVTRTDLSRVIGMNPNLITMYINGNRTLAPWSAHNLGYGINRLVGFPLFDVRMSLGVLPPLPTISDPARRKMLTAKLKRTRDKRRRYR